MNKTIKILIPFGITFFFLYIAFRNVDTSILWDSLRQTHWLLITSASLMALLSMGLRAWRWQLILKPIKEISYQTTFTYTIIGFMIKNVLPVHAGEIIKPYLLSRREEISGISALTTVVIERLFDGMALITLLIVVTIFVPLNDWIRLSGLIIGVASFLLIGLLISLSSEKYKVRQKLAGWINKLPQKVRKSVQQKFSTFLLGLNIFKTRQVLIPLFLMSLLIWLELAAIILIIIKWYPFSQPVELNLVLASIVVIVILAFAASLPSSPGYFGTTQVGFIFALNFFLVHEGDSLGCSVIFNLTQYVPVTLGGLFFLFKEGLTFKHIRKEVRTT